MTSSPPPTPPLSSGPMTAVSSQTSSDVPFSRLTSPAEAGWFPPIKFSPRTAAGSFPLTQPRPERQQPRVIVLCFDGTGNKFGENSNVVRFFRALVKGKRNEQIVYYQVRPGIGTYNKRAFITHTMSTISSKLDAAVALHLDDHVKEGYQFIVQTYRPGDKICLFGFSRGAHTARVVAGMIYKVGILPKENVQQVDFAFNVYGTTGYHGYKLSREFKETFSLRVNSSVEFVGVWDTVSSVGIIPQMHPYTSTNYGVKTFRHALALDERRVRFRPNVWSEITLGREQELDVEIPEPETVGNAFRDVWDYKPPNRDHADVKEVWFAGCHADVGGGSHNVLRNQSLSCVPLRWMIKECILAKTGILFDVEYLKESLDFDFRGLLEDAKERKINPDDLGEPYTEIKKWALENSVPQSDEHTVANNLGQSRPENLQHRIIRHIRDVCDEIFDQLAIFFVWWILEFIPMLYTYQDPQGNWIRRRMCNFGRGRYIPFYENEIQVHVSVRERIQKTQEVGKPYVPNACNWDIVSNSPMLKYVK